MRLLFLLFVPLLLAFQPMEAKPQEKYKLSICTMFYNEARYFQEWIEYHLMMGVDHFYLYNNGSTDHYADVLAPYVAEGVVDLIDWPGLDDAMFMVWQKRANNHCLEHFGKDSKWIAFIDADEFIMPVKHRSIPEFLKGYEKYGGVKIFWQNYGTSFLPTLPDGVLVTEAFTWKAKVNNAKNEWGKTIAQPKKIKACFVHEMCYKKGCYDVTPSKKKVKDDGNRVQIDLIRLNHYYTRAIDYVYEVKIPRIEEYTRKPMSQEAIDRLLNDFNAEQDLIMLPYLEELKSRMAIPSLFDSKSSNHSYSSY